MKSILDPTFRYVPAVWTNVAETFARIRREQAEAAEARAAEAAAQRSRAFPEPPRIVRRKA